MSADGGAKKIFISHASDDPDWPETAVRALATKLKQRGANVLLDYWHERDVMRRNLSPAEWREWMQSSLDSADHVLCLCTSRYAMLARCDLNEDAGRGIAFEVNQIQKYFYKWKQQNKGWCCVLKLDGATFDHVVPADMDDACPRYTMPTQEDWLLEALVCQQFPTSITPDTTTVQVASEAVTPPHDALAEQCRLVCERLELADNFWQALCRDDLQRRQPAALAGHDSFVRWLTDACADDADEVMFAARRALDVVTRKTDVTADACRLAELAAVSVYCLAVCRLVDVAALGKSYRFPPQAKDAASLYCAVLATVLCGGRLELAHSQHRRAPKPSHAYDIRVPGAGDHGPQVFEQALYQALCSDSLNAPEDSTLDGPLTSAQRAQIKARIRTIRRRERHALTLVLHDASHQASADAFSQAHGVPVFVCDPDVSEVLIGMTAEELAADIEELWSELRFCNHHATNENSVKPKGVSKMESNQPVAAGINVSFGSNANVSLAVTAGHSSPATSAPVHVGVDPRTEQAWQALSKQVEELKNLLGDLASKKTRESVSQQIGEAEVVVKSGPGSDNPGRLKGVLEKIKSVGDAADGGEKIVAACGKALDYLLPLIS
jgi:CRISPR/Cas system-associated endoribonuclease Cas2